MIHGLTASQSRRAPHPVSALESLGIFLAEDPDAEQTVCAAFAINLAF